MLYVFESYVRSNGFRKYVHEHCKEVVLGNVLAIHRLDVLPFSHPELEVVQAGAFGKVMQAPDTCKLDLLCPALELDIKPPP